MPSSRETVTDKHGDGETKEKTRRQRKASDFGPQSNLCCVKDRLEAERDGERDRNRERGGNIRFTIYYDLYPSLDDV